MRAPMRAPMRALKRAPMRSAPLAPPLLGAREILRAAEEHAGIARIEAKGTIGLDRSGTVSAHPGHLDRRVDRKLVERPPHRMCAFVQDDRMQARLQVLGGVDRVARAAEEPAEQAIALLADRPDALQHAIQWHP